MLHGLAEDDEHHASVTGVRVRFDAAAPLLDECLGAVAIPGHERHLYIPWRPLRPHRVAQIRQRLVFRLAAHVRDRIRNPPDVHLLAGDDVLVRVVEVVMGHVLRDRDVALQHGVFVPIELAQEDELFCGFHELCFSLQVMQTRVQGMALSRGWAMGSPQSRQMP